MIRPSCFQRTSRELETLYIPENRGFNIISVPAGVVVPEVCAGNILLGDPLTSFLGHLFGTIIPNDPPKIQEFGSFLPEIWAPEIGLKLGVAVPAGHVSALPCLSWEPNIKFHIVCDGGHQVTF